MDLQCYLDWCPVNTLPIDVVTIASYGQTRRRAERAGATDPLFTRFPELQSYEYAVRSDGLMLLRLGFDDDTAQELRSEIARDSSNTVKEYAGHIHDFHNYCPPETGTGFIAQACRYLTRYLKSLVSPQRELHKRLDYALTIGPVEIDKSAVSSTADHTRLDTEELHTLTAADKNGWLRDLLTISDPMDQGSEPHRPERAMLKLRRHFANKKDRVIHTLYRENTRAQSRAAPGAWVYSLLGFLGSLLLLKWILEDWIPAVTIALILSFGIFVLTDLAVRAPKLELLQRAIGYFAYANIYMRLMDHIFRGLPGGTNLEDTGCMDDARNMLEANYRIERDVIHKRRITLGLLFAMVTLSAALIKAYS